MDSGELPPIHGEGWYWGKPGRTGSTTKINHSFSTTTTQLSFSRKKINTTVFFLKKKNLNEKVILYCALLGAPGEGSIGKPDRPLTYESAQAAAKELNLRGITMETLGRSTARVGIEERLQQALPWQQTSNPEDTATWANRIRHQDFQRKWWCKTYVSAFKQTKKRDTNWQI